MVQAQADLQARSCTLRFYGPDGDMGVGAKAASSGTEGCFFGNGRPCSVRVRPRPSRELS